MTRFARFLLALTMLLSVNARAAELGIQQELAQSQLLGKGSYRWFGIKLYDAFLWQARDASVTIPLLEGRFVLELVYARELKGQRIAAASLDEIRKLNLGSPEQQSRWLHLMQQIFPDVTEGTRLSGVYQAGQGARFYRDGVLLSRTNDAEFARAFFSIWLDKRSSAPALRQQLLGRAL